MTPTETLTTMWGVLTALWLIASGLQVFLVYLSWPAERLSRCLLASGCIAFLGYFVWRLFSGEPQPPTHANFVRNDTNLFFVLVFILDGIFAAKGIVERRARHAAGAKVST